MLEAMRQLALDYLFKEIGNGSVPIDLGAWFKDKREKNPQRIIEYLTEGSYLEHAYLITPSPQNVDEVFLDIHDISQRNKNRLPWAQIKGPNSGDFGPVMKRSVDRGPKKQAQGSTFKRICQEAANNMPWSNYFLDIQKILQRRTIVLHDGSKLTTGEESDFPNILSAAIESIPETKKPVFLAIVDSQGRWPGDVADYVDYLLYANQRKYSPDKAPAKGPGKCSLCDEQCEKIFPYGVSGAGINIGNVDRNGAFPSLSLDDAWKGFAICGNCADLLYIYKSHVINKNAVTNKRPFGAHVAGDPALIIPYTNSNSEGRQKLLQEVEDYVHDADTSSDVGENEETILDILKDQKALLNLTFLWADVGQNIENLRGVITDVPPSRLKTLSESNEQISDRKHPLFPDVRLGQLEPDLSLSGLRSLFKRPGGKKAKDANNSQRLFQLRRNVAECVYKSAPIPEQRFWNEVMTTARWYWKEAIAGGSPYPLLNEGLGKKGPFLTAAGWCRYLTMWIYYFQTLEVMQMAEDYFEPSLKELKPYFGAESGIDNPQKAYAFLLGVLYGKVLQVQAARGVNVGANALTWLKRLTLTGRDLPQLYVKIREKLLAYETEKSAKVRGLLEELAELGVRIGDDLVVLDDTSTCYYLLLGQSLSNKILSKNES